ncbi:hypothetical protein QBC32DRAFT_349521 [Pseudoneurospora amorphoporcata]|uniref:BTB domain-containing protein n=1 Tax=Pseudoneurospora amorphoporcata TaxID=241081 RepID=A0AAN6SD80_9PEZI|nr:hypothetical protein QBC32DRAFT_349521 [Pseudoneurospora amorphoporcata]
MSTPTKPPPLNGGAGIAPSHLEIIDIVPDGDIILDVTFETSKPVIFAAKKAFAAFSSRPTPRTSNKTSGQGPAKTPLRPPRPPPKPRVRVGFRVHLSVLKEHSPYFARLLSDTRFAEAKAVEAAFAKLSLQNVSPGEADWTQLPRVSIREDDEATQSAELRYVFHDLLYILHHGGLPAPPAPTVEETPPPTDVTPPVEPHPAQVPPTEPKAAPAPAPTPKSVSKPATKTATPVKGQRPGGQTLGKTPAKTPAKAQPNGLKKPLEKTPPELRVDEPKQPSTPPLTIPYLITLSLLADRFSCTSSLSRLVSSSLSTSSSSPLTPQIPIKWPPTPTRITKDQDGHALTLAGEELLRQKILVSWLLDFPLKFQAATRELIMYGSRRWTLSATPEDDEEEDGDDTSRGGGLGTSAAESMRRYKARWWSLPDVLEDELSYRRNCLLSVLASIPRHFLRLYIVRPPQTRSINTSSAGIGASFTSNAASALQAAAQGRQCKLGYESSMSCDSYQLGEMIRFLCTKGLFALVDFSPMSFDRAINQYDGGENPLAKVDAANGPGTGVVFGPPKPSFGGRAGTGLGSGLGGISTMEVSHFISILRQCPSYQIDRNHTNCGFRTRILPLLEYVQAMFSSEIITIKRGEWEKRKEEVSWVSLAQAREDDDNDREKGKRVFKFTRSLAADPRMRYASTLGTGKMAMELFLADEWDWTAEEY